jgi:mannose-6-phosphate isomerase-like protein (cupin superfamily)
MSSLLPSIEITRQARAIFVNKGNGTRVNYYIFPEFEIHDNEIAPNTEQEWHHHKKIEEVLFINSGALTVRWLDNKNGVQKDELQPGDMIRVGASTHTFANNSTKPVHFTVFRYVPDGTDKHELIKSDRYPDKVEQAV